MTGNRLGYEGRGGVQLLWEMFGQMRTNLLDYMNSKLFEPKTELTADQVKSLMSRQSGQ